MKYDASPTFSFTVYGPASDPAMDPDTPEGREALMKYKRHLFERWLDAPCVALDYVTPREAVGQPDLHQYLRRELRRMEQIEATLIAPNARMSLDFLWETLGLERDAPAGTATA